MELISRMEASRKLKVSPQRIDRWAESNRIRVFAWMSKKPVFTKEAIEEVRLERERDPQRLPSKKDPIGLSKNNPIAV